MSKLLITGGSGKLAQEILKANKVHDIISPCKKDLDVTDLGSLLVFMEKHNPDIVIHAGAYTKPMRKHEDHPDVSIQTNIIGTSNMVLGCMSIGCKLVYISTDYVYPGTEGNYVESSPTSPYPGSNDGITKYGWSKLGGECAVRMYNGSLRICCNRRKKEHTL